jgi:hypothetical protein
MITPPELRWQAQRLLSDAKRASDGTEETILLDLALRLSDVASAIEMNEANSGPMRAAPCASKSGNPGRVDHHVR